VSIFIKYWNNSAGMLPPVDIRAHRTSKSTPISVRYARMMTHPILIFGSSIAIGLLGVALIIGIYTPLLRDYQNGCVQNDGGTLITTNANAVAFNVAVLEGNKELAHQVEQYDVRRSGMCQNAMQSAMEEYLSRVEQLSIVREAYRENAKLQQQMKECTDPKSWSLATKVFTDTSLQMGFIGDFEGGCKMEDFRNLGTLQKPRINCTELPACEPICKVDADSIAGNTRDAGCTSEWWFHATVLKGVCTAVVWLMWNVCRNLLVSGLVRLTWRHLMPHGFAFLGSCNLVGEIEVDTEHELSTNIAIVTTKFERFGWVLIVAAVLLNVPYILLCYFLNLDIEYT
jgi:hypothetical protein